MKFYFENRVGDEGYFEEESLAKAIHLVWNYEACLFLCEDDKETLIFDPYDTNEEINEILKDYNLEVRNVHDSRVLYPADAEENAPVEDSFFYMWDELRELI